ncbi:hypothetical protein [Paenisporosarcina sp. TG20]|uniref:hypothetical protein n=1 Tax=Paenisporosarcina sp. TG20 TaxID=1211706 RepID=UPI00030173C9|nr:hypothetical protein [Paenisporosarcina sp. TG20]
MSSEQIIDTADIRWIEGQLVSISNETNNLSDQIITLNGGMNYVSNQVDLINKEVNNTKVTLDTLVQEFKDFIRKDELEKSVQLSETRIVKVRQELETKFGHYADVRNKVTGILQAVDISLVRKETIENATEEQMLSAPRYWLAPSLIALSAWLNDNKALAEKAMHEALRRDEEKTSLFFVLVTRRGARYKSSREWLDRYFGLQDPQNLEREIVILIDGFTNGIFGPDARIKCGKIVAGWIEELSQKDGFVEDQHEQWKVALESKIQHLDEDSYTYLTKYSPSWSNLKNVLEGAKLHQTIYSFFDEIFTREITPAKNIAYAVDELLDKLVSKFDDEELPLRKEERQLSLIIQENGDRTKAQSLFDNEKALEERVSFTQLLTNFAMLPEVSQASLATQKFSIALTKEWIKNAHEDITAENRADVPMDIELEIDQWRGVTKDGSNEQELVQSMEHHIKTRKTDAMKQVKLEFKYLAALAGSALTVFAGFNEPAFMSISTLFLFIVSVSCFVYFYLGKRNTQKRKDAVKVKFANLLDHCLQELRATLADTVDWRKEYIKEDQNAELVTNLLHSITSEQYSFSRHDIARSIVN